MGLGGVMRLARKRLRCPECDEELVGLVQKIITTGSLVRDSFQTEWICESCDEAYSYIKIGRKMRLIQAYEAERIAEEMEP